MNPLIENFIGAVTEQTLIVVLLFIAVFLLGIAFGRTASVPFRKTRYFVDNLVLRRWQAGQSKTEGNYGLENSQWFKSSKSFDYLLKNCQEIDGLTAYRMFPQAFSKQSPIINQ